MEPTPCGLCGERPAELDFYTIIPIPETEELVEVRGEICLVCWSNYECDTAVAAALVLKQMEEPHE